MMKTLPTVRGRRYPVESDGWNWLTVPKPNSWGTWTATTLFTCDAENVFPSEITLLIRLQRDRTAFGTEYGLAVGEDSHFRLSADGEIRVGVLCDHFELHRLVDGSAIGPGHLDEGGAVAGDLSDHLLIGLDDDGDLSHEGIGGIERNPGGAVAVS